VGEQHRHFKGPGHPVDDYFAGEFYTPCPELTEFLAELKELPVSEWRTTTSSHPGAQDVTPNWALMHKYFPENYPPVSAGYGGSWHRSINYPRSKPLTKKTPCRFPPGVKPPKLHADTPPGILESSFEEVAQKRRLQRRFDKQLEHAELTRPEPEEAA
jgi:hypothetical protein